MSDGDPHSMSKSTSRLTVITQPLNILEGYIALFVTILCSTSVHNTSFLIFEHVVLIVVICSDVLITRNGVCVVSQKPLVFILSNHKTIIYFM
jgi:hypothetical protein